MTRVADRLLIAGVGLIGASLGLALRERGAVGEIVGLGRSAANLRTAKRRGAIDRTERDPERACRDVDLVVVATPVATIAPLIASMIAAPQSSPGRMSRGAIQQESPRCSSPAQTASATGLSAVE